MRTTLRINDRLFSKAKKAAVETHRTLTAVIEEALHMALEKKAGEKKASTPFKMITFKGTGPAPGINLDDSSSLMSLLDAEQYGSHRR